MDALSTSDEGQIAWYENTDGGGAYGEEIVDREHALGVRPLFKLPPQTSTEITTSTVLASIHSRFDAPNGLSEVSKHSVVWYDNDGTGAFSDPQVILTAQRSLDAPAFQAVDLDGDRDIDRHARNRATYRVAWYENVDGNGGCSLTQTLLRTNGWCPIDAHCRYGRRRRHGCCHLDKDRRARWHHCLVCEYRTG